ncbi:MAG: hypothetical protein ACRDG7_03150 [Candidatus Limnocylindria bacterium]
MTPLGLWPIFLGAAIIVAAGFLRRDRLLIVSMTTVGYLMVMLALLWSWDLGRDATSAIFLAAIGATLVTMGTERSRHEKRDRSRRSDQSVGRT